VLCPMNRGAVGARALNVALQAALNPAEGQPSVERFGYTYRPGDKVMQVENDYDKETFNGDLGLVKSVDVDAQEVVITFDGRDVSYSFGELDEVSLAFATTIHKSQGSEYPAVVIPVAMTHYMMLRRNLVYTGVTRGKRLVVLVGQRKALGIAVRGSGETPEKGNPICEPVLVLAEEALLMNDEQQAAFGRTIIMPLVLRPWNVRTRTKTPSLRLQDLTMAGERVLTLLAYLQDVGARQCCTPRRRALARPDELLLRSRAIQRLRAYGWQHAPRPRVAQGNVAKPPLRSA
jgi:ATP-dependent RecD-like DNA helicase SH3 domain/UvrD-like helicase C-terminal domain